MDMTSALRGMAMVFLLLSSIAAAQTANHVVISEFATRGGTVGNQPGEFVELYNPTNADISIAGWRLEYQSASGSSYSPLATVPQGTVIRARSFYLFAGTSWAGSPAADVVWTSSGLADNGNLRIVTATGQVVDRVGYGTGNNPEGTPAPNHGDAANDNSVERRASATSTAASLATGGAEARAGNGWDSGNNAADFVVQSNGRNPQNAMSAAEPPTAAGSGAARLLLARANGGETVDVPLSFTPSKEFAIEALAIVLPSGVSWSGNSADVLTDDGMQGDVEIRGDTVLFARVQFAADSTVITMRGITTPAITGNYPFRVLTGYANDLDPIEQSPALFVKGGPIPIAEARENDASGVPVKLNNIVTINGVVTVAAQFGAPAYVQDHSGGIAVYDFNFTGSVAIGDEVTLTGKIVQFNGLTELTEVEVDARPSTGNVVEPVLVTIPDLLNDGVNGLERYEGTLVRLNGVTVNTSAWTVTGSGVNYLLSDGSAQMDVRIDNDVPFAGQPAPGGTFDIVGVISQFQRNAPFVGGYQLMPRIAADIIAIGPRITSVPEEMDIQPDRVTIVWGTALPAYAFVRYGTTDAFELGVAAGNGLPGTEQQVTLGGLAPATIYRVQPFSVADGDTSAAQPFYISSASATSTGDIIVSFNQGIDNTLYPPLPASSNVNLVNRLLNRIDAAQHSIDLCLYSLSGQAGTDIVDRLVAAKGRGVRIRAILESDNASSAAISTLRANVPTIVDNFDKVNAGAGLQHNKFVVIDGRDRGSDTDDWVLSGSWNPTDPGSFDDAQNVIEIQDQALANAYTREFEEMWGADGETANSTASRFGARKLNNTPHRFVIGAERVPVELYFSPSDNVTSMILREVRRATRSLYFALLTFTRDDIARDMATRHRAGLPVRGVMDNSSDQGSRYDWLRGEGVDVWLKKGIRGLLHHKYLLVDAEEVNGTQAAVLTGSHNWSNAAEFANNENTLIIRSGRVAVQFLQEWYRRYRDAGGSGTVLLGSERLDAAAADFAIAPAWPNPVAGGAIVRADISVPRGQAWTLSVHDVLGREVAMPMSAVSDGSVRRVSIGTGSLPAGVYFLRVRTTTTMRSTAFTIQ